MRVSGYTKAAIFFSLFCALSAGGTLYAQETNEYGVEILRFRKVEDGLFRGGQPHEKDFKALQQLGIKTIVSLRDNEEVVSWEEKTAARYGMAFVNFPLNAAREMPADVPGRFLDVVTEPANRPVFVHCYHGKDRTGALIALYRIVHHALSPEEAYEEARGLGFDPIFVKYKDFILNEAITYRTTAGAER
ncbi:MAG: tyrosine-protein phosphatase [Candidatus Omnitrophica bacterium]|nr:tyrosine-protein phosphatase [Candidatus Omnitrophota bacterium]